MDETKTTPRQRFIVNVVNESQGIGRAGIEEKIKLLYPASKPTIARDLASLVRAGSIKIKGHGRSPIYIPASNNPLLARFDLDQYFALCIIRGMPHSESGSCRTVNPEHAAQ